MLTNSISTQMSFLGLQNVASLEEKQQQWVHASHSKESKQQFHCMDGMTPSIYQCYGFVSGYLLETSVSMSLAPHIKPALNTHSHFQASILKTYE